MKRITVIIEGPEEGMPTIWAHILKGISLGMDEAGHGYTVKVIPDDPMILINPRDAGTTRRLIAPQYVPLLWFFLFVLAWWLISGL